MNLHPTDYLNNLNLDFDSVVSPNLSEYNSQQLQNELDIFSQSDFFDLDVLSADNVVPIKQKVQFQEQQQQQQQQPSVVVKTEDDIALSFLNLPSEGNGAFPEEKLACCTGCCFGRQEKEKHRRFCQI